MAASPPPLPNPEDAGYPATSLEWMPGNNRHSQPTTETEWWHEESPLGFRMGPGLIPPPLQLTPLSLDLNVHRRALDPFILGVLIGAIAAIMGMFIGWFTIWV